MNYYSFIIPGPPKVQKRHRVSRYGGMYDPSAADKKVIAEYALEARTKAGMTCFKGDCTLWIGLWGLRTNSDIDNAAKLIMDACNRICWNDDRQIVRLVVDRFKGKPAKTSVAVYDQYHFNV